MAMQASSLCFLLISFFITSSCSEAAISSVSGGGNGKTISLLHGNVPKSHIRILVTDHRILESQTQTHSNNNFSIDFYLNESLTETLITSKPSSLLLPWLNSHILNSLPELNIKSIIFSCGSECFTKNQIPSLVSSLRSVHSLLLTNQVKLSVAFPLSLLENLNSAASHKRRDLSSILSFIEETKSYVMIEDNMNNDVKSIVERATSVLGCKDVPLILSMKSKAISKMGHKMSRRIVALYVQEEDLFVESKKRRALDEVTNSQNTVYPSNPTAPVITPPDTPTIITVPSTNPVTTISPTTPTNPSTMPVTIPSSTPVPLPPTTTMNNPPPAPVTNPVTSPAQPPPAVTTPTTPALPAPASQGGQSWCVAKNGAAEAALQAALDYACGMGGADCSQIQQGASCYSPVTLQNHASFAFNSYYQKHPGPTSCDFGGTATLVNTNPSSGSCIFPSSSSSSSSSQSPTTPMQSPPTTTTTTPPTMQTTPPTITTSPPSTTKSPPTPSILTSPPTTPSSSSTSGSGTSGYGTPPSVLNSSNPTTSTSGIMPGFGSQTAPPESSTTTTSSSSLISFNQTPIVGYMVQLLISFVTATIILHT